MYLIEIRPDLSALLRFGEGQAVDRAHGDEDWGYGIHAWMAAAFGSTAPKPWRFLWDQRRPPRILGYSDFPADALRQHLHEFADPGACAVTAHPETDILSRSMPRLLSGRTLGFEVQGCPVGRQDGTGVEKDFWLLRQEASSDSITRDAAYRAWLTERMARNGAVTLGQTSLQGFRLVHQTRKTQAVDGKRKKSRLTRPQALFRGELTVGDAEAFATLLRHGIGRHRAFGYGMLLLRPRSTPVLS